MKKRPLIFPLSSFSTLSIHPFIIGTNDFVYGRLIPVFMSHLAKQKKEGRLIELGGCNCIPLYPLIEEIHYNNSEDTLPPLSTEERYSLYVKIQSKMQANKTYSKFFNSLYSLYNKVLREYEKTHSIDSLLSSATSFLSLLFLNFQFESSLQNEIGKLVIDAGFFSNIFSNYPSGRYYKFIHFLFCGVPIYNYAFSPLQDTDPSFIQDFYIFPTDDDIETAVYYFHVPIYLTYKE